MTIYISAAIIVGVLALLLYIRRLESTPIIEELQEDGHAEL